MRDLCRQHREKRRRGACSSGGGRCARAGSDDSAQTPPVDFSMVEVPEVAVGAEVTRLTSGVVDGVPYVMEAATEAQEEEEDRPASRTRRDFNLNSGVRQGKSSNGASMARSPPGPGGFTLLSDGTENFSLNQSLYVEGEQWTVEGSTTVTAVAKEALEEGEEETNLSSEPGGVSPPPVTNDNDCPEGDWTPLLMLVPVRLGRERMNQFYSPVLRECLARPDCVGAIGGRPRHSLYFVGFQDENLIHLDPHLVQDHVDVFHSRFPLSSFHCRAPRKMHISKMDPSCCVGFYFQTRVRFCSVSTECVHLPATF